MFYHCCLRNPSLFTNAHSFWSHMGDSSSTTMGAPAAPQYSSRLARRIAPEKLDALIAMGLDPTMKIHKALRWAARLKEPDALKMLSPSFRQEILEIILLCADDGNASIMGPLVAHTCPNLWNSKALETSASWGHAACVKVLLAADVPQCQIDLSLACAASGGYVECVKMILPLADAQANNSNALRLAAAKGRLECLRLLLPKSNPSAACHAALRYASCNGHAECVEALLPLSDNSAARFDALQWACESGHAACARILAPHCDSMANGSSALMSAIYSGHASCVEILLPYFTGCKEAPDFASLELIAAEDGEQEIAALIRSHAEHRALSESTLAAPSKPSRAAL